ncbi:hypothetical protein V6N11_036676 [Hibiscus sabdariffa]|uniref:RNase H type-1 domain-containing protein n=1 Tax=Hibiscus sabdariffa TaxID=183260 RepID=A0ABR2RBV8_9ROSI
MDVHASPRGVLTVNDVHGKGVVHVESKNVLTHIPGPGGSSLTASGFGKSDPWLPSPYGGLVRGQSIDHNYTLVSDLIDAQTATWKVEVLHNLFDSDLVKQVCSIPLSRTDLGDEVVWRYDGSGLYNVKSGYKLLQEERQSNSGTYIAAPLLISRFYSSMWGVSLPAKGIQLANQYPDVPWMEWLALVFEKLSSAQRHALMEYEMLNLQCDTRSSPIQAKWEAPLEDVVKVNFDSAFSHQTLQSVSGVICRDNAGSILAACSLPHKYVRDAFMAEALSCQQAVMSAWELGFTRVILEGDSRTVIQKCKSELIDASLISPVIANIKSIYKNFMYLAFGYVRRDANVDAHTLAQERKAFDCPMYWIEEAPPRTLLAAEEDRAAFVSG